MQIATLGFHADSIQQKFSPNDDSLYEAFVSFYKEHRTQKIPKNAIHFKEATSTLDEISKLSEEFIQIHERTGMPPLIAPGPISIPQPC